MLCSRVEGADCLDTSLIRSRKLAAELALRIEPVALDFEPQLVAFAEPRCVWTHRDGDRNNHSWLQGLHAAVGVHGLLQYGEIRIEFTMSCTVPSFRYHISGEAVGSLEGDLNTLAKLA